MIIIGIDPGFERLGWAVGEIGRHHKKRLSAYGLITTSAHDSTYQRYLALNHQLEEILTEYQPHEAALENLFFQSNQKTVMRVAEARGVMMSAILRQGVPIAEYTPPQIKATVTGYGRADKEGVEKMIRAEFTLAPEEKIIDDTIDAMAVLLTHIVMRQNGGGGTS